MPPGSGGSQWQLLLSFVAGCPPERATVNVHLVAIDEPLDVCGHRDARRIGGLVCFRPRRLVDSGLQQHSLETFDVGALGTTSDRRHDQSMAVNGCILRDLACERFVSAPKRRVEHISSPLGGGTYCVCRRGLGRVRSWVTGLAGLGLVARWRSVESLEALDQPPRCGGSTG